MKVKLSTRYVNDVQHVNAVKNNLVSKEMTFGELTTIKMKVEREGYYTFVDTMHGKNHFIMLISDKPFEL
jgi:hypothetical protein